VFFGVLAYDDWNIPLTENGGVPVALIIGDYNTIDISSCSRCRLLAFRWSY
jgi:hypothetical protein